MLCPNLEIVLPLEGSAREDWKKAKATGRVQHSFADHKVPHPSR